jgi:hypothetical protein
MRKLKKRRTTNASFSKKTQFVNSLKMKRCKSTGSVLGPQSPHPSGAVNNTNTNTNTNSTSRHNGATTNRNQQTIPWRSAARANRYRLATSCAHRKLTSPSVGLNHQYNINDNDYAATADDDVDEDEFNSDDIEEFLAQNDVPDNLKYINNSIDNFLMPEPIDDQQHHQQQSRYHGPSMVNDETEGNIKHHMFMASSTLDYDKFSSLASLNNANTAQRLQTKPKNVPRPTVTNKNEFVANLDKIKNVSVKDLLAILQREHESKTQLEDMLIEVF